MDRNKKIKLLQDLEAGKTTIAAITMPEQHTFYETQSGLFNVAGGLKLTRAELNDYINKHPAKRVHIYELQPGNEPLADYE